MQHKTTVAIVSDTHGFLDPRIAKIVQDCHYAVHAGDVMAASVLDAMRPRSGHVVAVAGNNDVPEKWSEFETEIVHQLPHVAELELPGGILAIEHGHRYGHHAPRHDLLRRSHPHARAIAYGHSHQLICDQDEQPWVINPGAAGRVRTHGGPSCLVLTATRESWTLEVHRFALHADGVAAHERIMWNSSCL